MCVQPWQPKLTAYMCESLTCLSLEHASVHVSRRPTVANLHANCWKRKTWMLSLDGHLALRDDELTADCLAFSLSCFKLDWILWPALAMNKLAIACSTWVLCFNHCWNAMPIIIYAFHEHCYLFSPVVFLCTECKTSCNANNFFWPLL